MEKVYSIEYRGYEIAIFRDAIQFTFQIFKDGAHISGFNFSVNHDVQDSMPWDVEETYNDFIQICKNYIDLLMD